MSRIVERAPASSDCGKPSTTKAKRIATKRGQRPVECRELFLNLSEYLDGKVEPRTCDQMRQHIDACPACVAFLRDLRAAIDRCRSLEVPCDSAVAPRLRSILTQEYLRLLGLPGTEKVPAVL
jgi:RNA polymerase sigma-70 factor (ECF subfamily)